MYWPTSFCERENSSKRWRISAERLRAWVVVRGTAQCFKQRARVPSEAQSWYPYGPPMDGAQFDDEALDASTQLLAVAGELDLTNVSDLRRRIQAAFATGPPRLVIDLSRVTHMDSTGLAELISAHQRAMDLRGRLVLVVTAPAILRTLEIRGVVDLFAIVGSRDGARELLAG